MQTDDGNRAIRAGACKQAQRLADSLNEPLSKLYLKIFTGFTSFSLALLAGFRVDKRSVAM
jgi:hypothetical protein